MSSLEALETLTLEIQDGVALVMLNRPPVNAVSRRMQTELRELFADLAYRKDVGAVVLGAEGDRAFCGGIDLREVGAQGVGSADELQDVLDPGWEWRAAQHAIRHCPVPVICAVEAAAVGAGVGLVGVSDIVVASTNASFALTEINVGLLGGASKALRLVGPSMTRLMMFTGRRVSAEELHRHGGVTVLVKPGRALDEALEIAREICTKSPLAIRLAKQSIVRIETDEMETQYRTEWDYTNRLRTLNDSREALEAYVERREPQWSWT
jgi:enoyl-CoA hydratase